MSGDQRKGHAGEEARRAHDERAQGELQEDMDRIARLAPTNDEVELVGRAEDQVSEEHGKDRGYSHQHLSQEEPVEGAFRVRRMSVHVPFAERQPEEEGGEHDIERMSAGSEEQGEVPGPPDLAGEGRKACQEADRKQQVEAFSGAGASRGRPARLWGSGLVRRFVRSGRSDGNRSGDDGDRRVE